MCLQSIGGSWAPSVLGFCREGSRSETPAKVEVTGPWPPGLQRPICKMGERSTDPPTLMIPSQAMCQTPAPVRRGLSPSQREHVPTSRPTLLVSLQSSPHPGGVPLLGPSRSAREWGQVQWGPLALPVAAAPPLTWVTSSQAPEGPDFLPLGPANPTSGPS